MYTPVLLCSKYAAVRKKAFDLLGENAPLELVLLCDPTPFMRHRAAKMMQTGPALHYAALWDEDESIRCAFLSKAADFDIISWAALQDVSPDNREIASARLKNLYLQPLNTENLNNTNTFDFSKAFLYGLEALTQVLRELYETKQLEAVQELQSLSLLKIAACMAKSSAARIEAIRKLGWNGMQTLCAILLRDPDPAVRSAAAAYIPLSPSIFYAALHDEDERVRMVCIENISVIEILLKIADVDPVKDNRTAASLRAHSLIEGVKNVLPASIVRKQFIMKLRPSIMPISIRNWLARMTRPWKRSYPAPIHTGA